MGGLLVALAVLGTWWAATSSDRTDTESFVVAARTLAPGSVLTSDDLTTAEADLGPSLRGQVFSDPATLVGTVTLGPLSSGELLQAGSLAAGPEPSSGGELSFAVEVPRAVAGTIRAGDRIDVYATFGDGDGAETIRILHDATVREAETLGDALGERRHQVITVSLDAGSDVVETVNATRAATLTVVRVTGTDR